MSDSEDYEYEYDESDQSAMDDGGDGGGGGGSDDDEQSFEYTDDESGGGGGGGGGGNDDDGDGDIALENAYYNAKSERDAGEFDEARATFESVVRTEVGRKRREAGLEGDADEGERDADDDADDDAMDVDAGSGGRRRRLTPLAHHGLWSYKAIKQLVKLHLRIGSDGRAVARDYARMLRVASCPDAGVSPNALEKGVNGMLDRAGNLVGGGTSPSRGSADGDDDDDGEERDPRALARTVYDLTLDAFHPANGISPNERLWFKTNLKYGQLLYEMNETAKLQSVIRDLLRSSGQPADVLDEAVGGEREGADGGGGGYGGGGMGGTGAGASSSAAGGTHVMEIAALQIQLYSRLRDAKRLRAAYRRAMSVRGGIPHPRTLALIQELGGKMHMDQRNFHEASQAFFQAFKSYDEAGDRSRLRCLKYLVMASMLHASTINPFDSHEARAHRDDPEIVAMTNLVQAFHDNDVRAFERTLGRNEGRIMDDDFVREHVADLLRTIRTQVALRNVGPYARIRLDRVARDLNDMDVDEAEGLLVSLILEGRLDGRIDQVNGVLVKTPSGAGGKEATGGKGGATKGGGSGKGKSVEERNLASLSKLTSALEHLTTEMTRAGSGRGSSTSFHQQVLQ
ncbi:hypothetical protein ACHAWF_008097 [Thalassiosira exigua]